jgi:hypothetical protein
MTNKAAFIKYLILAATLGSGSYSFANANTVHSFWLQSKLEGTISDSNGPIAGASITVKGTGISTFSDENGHFSLSDVKSGSTLVISYMGYQSEEVVITNQTNLNITLEQTSSDLDEVVVVAYGTAK